MSQKSKKTRLADYKKPDFLPKNLHLDFTLDKTKSIIVARTYYISQSNRNKDLILNGEDIVLSDIKVNGNSIKNTDYTLTKETLILHKMSGEFDLEITTTCNPSTNTKLEGLYISDNMFCTQCEAEGFRHITYFQDRPDVMTKYSVTITALKSEYPILLSNGNRTGYNETDTHHTATWVDPHKKPSYLFALVAGDLVGIEDTFRTMDGVDVVLKIYTNYGNEQRLDYAMDSLKRSMKWDEEKWGRAYDLDVFHIVAVNDFNMGAMENKSLNIFNSRCILSDPDTATDMDFEMIESIVAHEYFHNWTGNRITCRDWFQLSLKEGLTVFRDQEFTSDERSRGVKRIEDVKSLRNRQFNEDASGLAHPVRPEEVIEINNFYTATIYDKGAEIIRMIHTILGHDTFYAGANLYFSTFDGQAVTVDDWIWAMEQASGKNLTHFKLWYSQAGTPNIHIDENYSDGKYSFSVKQTLSPTPNQDVKKPMVIPLSFGLIDNDGVEILPTQVYELTTEQQTFEIGTFDSKPILSFNRGFSAPVTLSGIDNIPNTELLFTHDTDTFNRWQAGQDLYTHCIVQHLQTGSLDKQAMNALYNGVKNILSQNLDNAFKAHCITMPSLHNIYSHLKTDVDTDAVHNSYTLIKNTVADTLQNVFNSIIATEDLNETLNSNAIDAGKRALINVVYGYVSNADHMEALENRYEKSNNMTTRMNALSMLCEIGAGKNTLSKFKSRYKDNPNVMNKYFALQMAQHNATPKIIDAILNDDCFTISNPNNARALYGTLGMNPVAFHTADGSMYQALANGVITLDAINPQISARLVQLLGGWKKFNTNRAEKMKDALRFILDTDTLSQDTQEMASKALQG